MTQKEKARELVDKFISYSYFSDGNNSMNRSYQQEYNAKQCALISVDEILNDYLNSTYPKDLSIKYWNEIKEEIQKLEK